MQVTARCILNQTGNKYDMSILTLAIFLPKTRPHKIDATNVCSNVTLAQSAGKQLRNLLFRRQRDSTAPQKLFRAIWQALNTVSIARIPHPTRSLYFGLEHQISRVRVRLISFFSDVTIPRSGHATLPKGHWSREYTFFAGVKALSLLNM
jgi:hypothetical protein